MRLTIPNPIQYISWLIIWGTVLQAPPTKEEHAKWRETIANEWQWSSAASQLQEFYTRHGYGLTQRYSVLEFKSGALQAFVPFQPGQSPEQLSETHTRNERRRATEWML